MPERKPRQPSSASQMIGLGGQHIDHDSLRNRFAEREQRAANDTRTPAQKWLGDPAPNRSALAHRDVNKAIDSLITNLKRR